MSDSNRKKDKMIKKKLIELTESVDLFLAALDDEMKLPSTFERGRRIATISNALNIKNDSAKHFGLGIPLEKC